MIGGVPGSITNPRYRGAAGHADLSVRYHCRRHDGFTEAAIALNDGVAQNYRDSVDSYTTAPAWAEYVITNLYQSTDLTASADGSYGQRLHRRRPERRR